MSLAKKQLEPGESLGEILFGIIMTLTFTLGAGVMVRGDPDAARELLIATIGCNIAWGIIDGALYVSGQVYERARLARLGDLVRRAATEDAAAAIVAEEFDELVGLTVAPAERDDLFLRMARHVRVSERRARGMT
ncbi:MAG: VIT1/CCC1 transporter family protein, partial [Solirubrobacteraceae bacterium]